MKKKIAFLLTTATVLGSAIPSFAAANITSLSNVDIKNSAVGTAVINEKTNIYAEGGKVDITAGRFLTVDGSIVGTLINNGDTILLANGKKVDVAHMDVTQIKDSLIGTLVSDTSFTAIAGR